MDLNSRKGRQKLFRLGVLTLLPIVLAVGITLELMNVNKYITLVVIATGLSMFSVRVLMSRLE